MFEAPRGLTTELIALRRRGGDGQPLLRDLHLTAAGGIGDPLHLRNGDGVAVLDRGISRDLGELRLRVRLRLLLHDGDLLRDVLRRGLRDSLLFGGLLLTRLLVDLFRLLSRLLRSRLRLLRLRRRCLCLFLLNLRLLRLLSRSLLHGLLLTSAVLGRVVLTRSVLLSTLLDILQIGGVMVLRVQPLAAGGEVQVVAVHPAGPAVDAHLIPGAAALPGQPYGDLRGDAADHTVADPRACAEVLPDRRRRGPALRRVRGPADLSQVVGV